MSPGSAPAPMVRTPRAAGVARCAAQLVVAAAAAAAVAAAWLLAAAALERRRSPKCPGWPLPLPRAAPAPRQTDTRSDPDLSRPSSEDLRLLPPIPGGVVQCQQQACCSILFRLYAPASGRLLRCWWASPARTAAARLGWRAPAAPQAAPAASSLRPVGIREHGLGASPARGSSSRDQAQRLALTSDRCMAHPYAGAAASKRWAAKAGKNVTCRSATRASACVRRSRSASPSLRASLRFQKQVASSAAVSVKKPYQICWQVDSRDTSHHASEDCPHFAVMGTHRQLSHFAAVTTHWELSPLRSRLKPTFAFMAAWCMHRWQACVPQGARQRRVVTDERGGKVVQGGKHAGPGPPDAAADNAAQLPRRQWALPLRLYGKNAIIHIR